VKNIESLLKILGVKFEYENLEIRFHKRQVSFLVVKTAKSKRDINDYDITVIQFVYDCYTIMMVSDKHFFRFQTVTLIGLQV